MTLLRGKSGRPCMLLFWGRRVSEVVPSVIGGALGVGWLAVCPVASSIGSHAGSVHVSLITEGAVS